MDIVNSFVIENERFYYYDITKVMSENRKLKKLPIVLKILLESNLRNAKDNYEFNRIIDIFSNNISSDINFFPSRVIMEGFNSLPILVDLASMRDAFVVKKKDIKKVNPQILVDLILNDNKDNEHNKEKYEFIKWAKNSFSGIRVVPPSYIGYNKLNLEYLSTVLHVEKKDEKYFLSPETVIGINSNDNMVNSLGILGLCVDSITAESSILGLPIFLSLPKVIGVNIFGELKEGMTSSDLVSFIIDILKKHNLSGEIVEFYGKGLKYLTLEDRTIILNRALEYKAKCSFFAIDNKTIGYFNNTRNNEDYSYLIKEYLQLQGLFFNEEEILDYDEVININLKSLKPIIQGPKRIENSVNIDLLRDLSIIHKGKSLNDTSIVSATIESTSREINIFTLIHAGLVAKKVLDFGIYISKSIEICELLISNEEKKYLEQLDLLKYLEQLGFEIIDLNNSDFKKLSKEIESEIKINNLNVCSISSGNRNFENNINPSIKSNYLMSPSLVIAYSLIGTMKFNILEDVICSIDNKEIRLNDLWPSNNEVIKYLQDINNTLYKDIYKDIFIGNDFWKNLNIVKSDTFIWNDNSTLIQASRFFEEINLEEIEIENAGILALLGDSILSEDISPLGQISLYSPVSKYLEHKGVKSFEYNSFKNRCGNAEVMVRGVFDNINNLMVSKEGAYTMDYEEHELVSIYEKSKRFKDKNRPLVVLAGSDYGKGNSRDWAVKGARLLGVKAVIAKSFDETHKSNLISLGVLPLEFIDDDIQSFKLKGHESITIRSKEIKENLIINAIIHKNDEDIEIELKCRLDTKDEAVYYKNGGVLPFLLKNIK